MWPCVSAVAVTRPRWEEGGGLVHSVRVFRHRRPPRRVALVALWLRSLWWSGDFVLRVEDEMVGGGSH